MVQNCTKCSRANPSDAVYCYFDGFVLGGHSHNGGPVAVGAQAFAHPFVFPDGRQCRSFDELAIACQEDWSSARNLLKEGYLENFFGGLGRVDLAMTAKAAAKFPDEDLGLDQLLEKLPSDVLAEPRLSLETQEINLGVLEIGSEREFHLRMENQGMRMVSGTVTSADAAWLALGDTAGNKKHFQFQHELALPIRVRPDKLRANSKPLEVHLEVESSGGSFIITVRAQVPVKPFPSGALAGAKSPRQAAEKAKAASKDAAVLFENGTVADWYKSNGWTYPVQGPAASGMAAIQQFFEALGLTAPPKVSINTERIELVGNPGEQLSASIEIKTQEKRPVYAHATSNQPWLEVGRAKLSGRVAAINLAVPSVPNKEGETLTAKLMVQANGNQRFVVPVTLRIGGGGGVASVGNSFAFDEPAPTANVEMMETAPAEPVFVPPSVVASKGTASRRHRRSPGGKPSWMHALPALLLLLVVLVAAAIDHLTKPAGTARRNDDIDMQEGGGGDEWTYNVKDADPLLAARFNDTMRFGLEMTKEKDPRPGYEDKYKKLIYDERGASNNTIVKIDGFEYVFGMRTRNNIWAGRGGAQKKVAIKGRKGWTSTMQFTSEKVEVVQHVEIVPGQSGYLDTLLVYYSIKNNDEGKHKVGIRVMLDTFIGANDGVPFTIPGQKGFVNTKKDFAQKQIPDYLEVIEKPNDPKDPGTVARMGLRNIKLPNIDLDDMDKLRICRFPGANARWDWEPIQSMRAAGKGEAADSCVAMYWPYENMNPDETRRVAFTYGLGSLEIGGGGGSGPALALSVPASVQPDHDFVATAYVWRAKKNAKVTLEVPEGLKLAEGEKAVKTVEIEKGSSRSQVFWHLRSGSTGEYKLEAATGDVQAKPKKVVVKTTSIFG